MENQYSWEQIEERAKRREQQIQKLHYSRERQVIKVSIFNQANEWSRLEMKEYKEWDFDNLAIETIRKWLEKLYHEWKIWDMEFDNLYFQNIKEKKKSQN
jgi:hypothetical protein